MRNDRTPTRLGELISQRMRELGMRRQVDVVRPGLSNSTVSRLIYQDDYLPDTETLGRLAEALQLNRDELFLFVHGGGGEVTVTAAGPGFVNARLAEAERMLAPDSPLSDLERQELDLMLDRMLEYYRELMRRKRSA